MRWMICLPALLSLAFSAAAQTPPSAAQIAAYDGLHRAAHHNDVAAIARLAAEGAALDARDRAGRSAVHVAAFASNDEALRALAEAGADMNALENQAYDVVTIAAVADDLQLLEIAIELGNRADLVTSPYRGTALIAAAHLGHHRIVHALIGAGAPLDHINNLGWTALMEAVVLGDGGPDHVETVRVLIDGGADPNIPDRGGTFALQHARARGYVEIANLLWKAAR